MTDQERAAAYVERGLHDELANDAICDAVRRDLAVEFGKVRAAERRTVAAFLRVRVPTWRQSGDHRRADSLAGLADLIERGEHGS
jgi:hypothetical protein